MNLQEHLDSMDILRKLTGMRIQDVYNTMLQTDGRWAAPQLMRVLQLVIRLYHRRRWLQP